jgi:cell wall assembly regulator SMI1
MKDVWRRVESQFRLQAPNRLSQLEPGAAPAQIDEFERLVGRPLPEDFRESYAIHDGAYGVPFGEFPDYLLTLEQIAGLLPWMREELIPPSQYRSEPVPVGPVRPVWWSEGWVPFVGEGTGDYLCLDLDPAEGGAVGQVFDWGHETGPTRVLFPSFRDYLERYAAGLERGAIRYDENEMGWVISDAPTA